LLRGVGYFGRQPLEADLVAVEEVAQLGAGTIPAVPEDDRPRRRWLSGDPLQPVRAAHPVGGQLADFLRDARLPSCDDVVVVRLDPQDARALRRTEADREDGAERDGDLAEEVTDVPLPDDPPDAVDELDR